MQVIERHPLSTAIGSSTSIQRDLLERAKVICLDHIATGTAEAREWHLLGLIVLRAGQPDFAAACLQRAAALAPANADYAADLAQAQERAGNLPEALTTARRVLTLAPEDARGHLRVGRLLTSLHRPEEAVEPLHAAIRLQPDNAALRTALGVAQAALTRLDEALVSFEAARGLDPANASTQARVGRLRLTRGEPPAAALTVFREGLALSPDSVELHLGLGDALLVSGALSDALEAFRAAVALEPRHAGACRRLTTMLAILGQREELVSAWCGLGSALERSGQDEEAEARRQRREGAHPSRTRIAEAVTNG
jgi:tetratricopeptide (TPR) repeat protein